MKKDLFLLALLGTAGAAASGVAHADVAWEHRGTIKLGKEPVAYLSLKNEWSGQKHRASLLFDASKFAKEMSFSADGPQKARGEFHIVERLDDDRLILSSPDSKSYIDEPYKSLKGRLRLNFWEALGSDLSATDVPELTPAQRARLGQELRGVITPLTKSKSRTYFRAIPEKKTINGLNSRGYRFTSMVNVSTDKNAPEWIRTSAEWWLADEQATDEEIRDFTQAVNAIKKDSGGPTASMWINEYTPVLWEAMPVEAHQALASIIGAPDSAKYGFQGTPVRFYVTVSPPPAAEIGMGGSLRFALELSKRSTTAVDTTLFEPPIP
ncbi:hypothetical protein EON80_20520, partial [bacterium]